MLKLFLHYFSYHSEPIQAFKHLFYFIVGALAGKGSSNHLRGYTVGQESEIFRFIKENQA